MKKKRMRRMRYMVSVLTAVICLLQTGSLSFADSNTNTGQSPVQIGVNAQIRQNGKYTATVKNGEATVRVGEQAQVTVKTAPTTANRLVVVPIPQEETQAWNWITECVGKVMTPAHAYDIYFEDGAGARIEVDGEMIAIACNHCTKIQTVCSLTTEGKVRVLAVQTESNKKQASFMTNGSPYYLLSGEGTEDQIFAGYYTDDSYKTSSTTVTDYKKYVEKNTLSVKLQTKAKTTETVAIRLVTTVDSLNYNKVGFRVKSETGVADLSTGTVYATLNGAQNVYQPTVFSKDSQYFVTVAMMDIPLHSKMTITPYWETEDGTVVEGVARVVDVSQLK